MAAGWRWRAASPWERPLPRRADGRGQRGDGGRRRRGGARTNNRPRRASRKPPRPSWGCPCSGLGAAASPGRGGRDRRGPVSATTFSRGCPSCPPTRYGWPLPAVGARSCGKRCSRPGIPLSFAWGPTCGCSASWAGRGSTPRSSICGPLRRRASVSPRWGYACSWGMTGSRPGMWAPTDRSPASATGRGRRSTVPGGAWPCSAVLVSQPSGVASCAGAQRPRRS
jgi:hypothetical protein